MEPITLDEAAALLGGSTPLPIGTVKKMARAGLFPIFGRGEGKRTFRESINTLLVQLAEGEVVWPLNAKRIPPIPKVMARSRKTKPEPMPDGYVRLVARPPKRTQRKA